MPALQKFGQALGVEPVGYTIRFKTDDQAKATIQRTLIWANNGSEPGDCVERECQTTLGYQPFFATLAEAHTAAWWWRTEGQIDADHEVIPVYAHPFGQPDAGEPDRRIELPICGSQKTHRAMMRVVNGAHYIAGYAAFDLRSTAFDGDACSDDDSGMPSPKVYCFLTEGGAHVAARANEWDPAYVRVVEVLIGLPSTPEQPNEADDETPVAANGWFIADKGTADFVVAKPEGPTSEGNSINDPTIIYPTEKAAREAAYELKLESFDIRPVLVQGHREAVQS